MLDQLSELITIEFILLALATYGITFILKQVINLYAYDMSPKLSKLAHKVVLPSLSIMVGGVLGFVFSTVLVGISAGLFCGFLYDKIREFIK